MGPKWPKELMNWISKLYRRVKYHIKKIYWITATVTFEIRNVFQIIFENDLEQEFYPMPKRY